jgi:hypothetical protein
MRLLRWSVPWLLLAACEGTILPGLVGAGGEPSSSPVKPVLPVLPVEPGLAPLRALTRAQLDNSLRDLLAPPRSYADFVGLELYDDGYSNQEHNQEANTVLVERYGAMAEEIARDLAADEARRTALVGCTPASPTDRDCLQSFLQTFARRLYRRPLEAEELADLVGFGLAEAARTNDFWAAVSFDLEVMLQSPSFLYRLETGAVHPARPDLIELDAHSLASRLSFLFWNTTPDDTLLALADSRELGTPEQLAAQVERLLAHPKARPALGEFHRQWLQVDTLSSVTRNPQLFPSFSPSLVASMQQQTARDLEQAAFSDVDFLSIFDADSSWVDGPLAQLYGMPTATAGFSLQRLPAERRGILGHASILANSSKTEDTSPTHRGLFVQTRLLCNVVPPPPNDVMATLPPNDPNAPMTTRAKLAAHSTNPSCSGCHRMMDGLGFGLEKFDAIGAYRQTEHGFPIDDSAEAFVGGARVPFAGLPALATVLRQAPEARRCLVSNFTRWSFGRKLRPEDEGLIDALDAAFVEGGNRFTGLSKALVASDTFRFMKAQPTPARAPLNHVINGSFESGTHGWSSYSGSLEVIELPGAPDGRFVVKVSQGSEGWFTLDDAIDSLQTVDAGRAATAAALVRAADPRTVGKRLSLLVRELAVDGTVIEEWRAEVALTDSFQPVRLSVTATTNGSRLDVRLGIGAADFGNAFYADSLSLE